MPCTDFELECGLPERISDASWQWLLGDAFPADNQHFPPDKVLFSILIRLLRNSTLKRKMLEIQKIIYSVLLKNVSTDTICHVVCIKSIFRLFKFHVNKNNFFVCAQNYTENLRFLSIPKSTLLILDSTENNMRKLYPYIIFMYTSVTHTHNHKIYVYVEKICWVI